MSLLLAPEELLPLVVSAGPYNGVVLEPQGGAAPAKPVLSHFIHKELI